MSFKYDDAPIPKAVVLPKVNAKSEIWLGEPPAYSGLVRRLEGAMPKPKAAAACRYLSIKYNRHLSAMYRVY